MVDVCRENKGRFYFIAVPSAKNVPETVADLYRCRWRIEVFFKQIKQTLQLADFMGTSANAVRWQIWTALLVYLLLSRAGPLGPLGILFTPSAMVLAQTLLIIPIIAALSRDRFGEKPLLVHRDTAGGLWFASETNALESLVGARFSVDGNALRSFIGVWLGGLLYDRTGSYEGVWWCCVALGVFAALANLPVRETPIARQPVAA